MLFKSVLAFFAAAQLVAGHGAIVKAVGDMGGNGSAIGIDASTPRDGTRRTPFQADSTRFKNVNPDACGETLGGGPNDPTSQVAKVAQDSNGLPMVSAGGMIMMTLHQVNGDGAGPYSCMIDSTGTGTGGWTKMEVATNVPGKNSRSKAKATDFPLSAKIAADQTCTGSMGGMDNVCMVRCNNAANAGPFGGCVPVQMVGAGAGAGAAAPAK
ncbi:putative eka-like protein [Erysiphe necator]|uniref:Putative eka-like protein n=1 Tax=Uncinula necator TaxID=52586 RepID=A0A0B1P060_UNCNE|nr:putative eka-like protein [Erysiphe necator]